MFFTAARIEQQKELIKTIQAEPVTKPIQAEPQTKILPAEAIQTEQPKQQEIIADAIVPQA